MLNWNQVLKYIKGRLALPSTFIEKNDAQIKDWIIDITIPEFSNHFPDFERTGVQTGLAKYQVPGDGKGNRYYFFDEEGLDIIGIKECFFPIDGRLLSGHPVLPAFSFEGMQFWSIEVLKSRFFHQYSMWNYTYQYISPNIVEINSDYKPDVFAVEYERVHPPDLRRIPAAMQRPFMDLCLADIMVWIGGIRSMYGDGRLNTPFGEIPLNGAELLSKGEDLRTQTLDKLIDDSRPPIMIDVG